MRSAAEILAGLRPRGIRLGLTNIRRVLVELRNPQELFAAVLVAGTNGKGSTAALLASMATAAGYRTGLFTSPALECEEEQIHIAGQAVTPPELASLLREVIACAERLRLTSLTAFEALTAAAFRHFARNRVELAVVEAGMGGARDSTNATDPIASIITTVGVDHCDYLGSTLAEIATDKAGVLRAGRPAVVGWIPSGEAEDAIRRSAERVGAVPIFARQRIHGLESRTQGLRGHQSVSLRTSAHSYAIELPLPGEHQARNLALAVLAAEALGAAGWSRLDPAAIRRGAAACRWPGRLELVRIPGTRPLLLDGAHNLGGAEALARFLGELAEPFDLLFGTLRDKDPGAMLRIVGERARRILLTAPLDERAWDPEAFAAAPSPGPEVEVEPQLSAALTRVLTPEPTLLVVAGSLRLVGDVLRLLGRSAPQGYL
ncbi:MAG: bifunctional folylpolyglutamate synthase/dihydrofolate synthase [bacterium]|nr:bifunctional folylpolyglutamate synthase/dihydrofolate synthase [bacterium]